MAAIGTPRPELILNKLPLEIHFETIENLEFEEILSLRSTNTDLKKIVDLVLFKHFQRSLNGNTGGKRNVWYKKHITADGNSYGLLHRCSDGVTFLAGRTDKNEELGINPEVLLEHPEELRVHRLVDELEICHHPTNGWEAPTIVLKEGSLLDRLLPPGCFNMSQLKKISLFDPPIASDVELDIYVKVKNPQDCLFSPYQDGSNPAPLRDHSYDGIGECMRTYPLPQRKKDAINVGRLFRAVDAALEAIWTREKRGKWLAVIDDKENTPRVVRGLIKFEITPNSREAVRRPGFAHIS